MYPWKDSTPTSMLVSSDAEMLTPACMGCKTARSAPLCLTLCSQLQSRKKPPLLGYTRLR